MFYFFPQGIPEALMKAGAVYKYDLSLPLERMYDLVDEMRSRVGTYIIYCINLVFVYTATLCYF